MKLPRAKLRGIIAKISEALLLTFIRAANGEGFGEGE
jgi:hypothetical protein